MLALLPAGGQLAIPRDPCTPDTHPAHATSTARSSWGRSSQNTSAAKTQRPWLWSTCSQGLGAAEGHRPGMGPTGDRAGTGGSRPARRTARRGAFLAQSLPPRWPGARGCCC